MALKKQQCLLILEGGCGASETNCFHLLEGLDNEFSPWGLIFSPVQWGQSRPLTFSEHIGHPYTLRATSILQKRKVRALSV